MLKVMKNIEGLADIGWKYSLKSIAKKKRDDALATRTRPRDREGAVSYAHHNKPGDFRLAPL
jgi:hypothetical protein